eukprot:3940392-Rhodomonas_salina.3
MARAARREQPRRAMKASTSSPASAVCAAGMVAFSTDWGKMRLPSGVWQSAPGTGTHVVRRHPRSSPARMPAGTKRTPRLETRRAEETRRRIARRPADQCRTLPSSTRAPEAGGTGREALRTGGRGCIYTGARTGIGARGGGGREAEAQGLEAVVNARENRGAPVAKSGGLEPKGGGLTAVADGGGDDGAPVAMGGGSQAVGADWLEEAQAQCEVDLDACTPVGTAAGGRPRAAVRGETPEVCGEVRHEDVVTVQVLHDGAAAAPAGAAWAHEVGVAAGAACAHEVGVAAGAASAAGDGAAVTRAYAAGQHALRVGGGEQRAHSALLVSLLYR